MSGQICDCCFKKDIETYVCSYSLGAISFAYCVICGKMGAEPRGLLQGFVEEGLMEEDTPFLYYDVETDTYKNNNDEMEYIIVNDEGGEKKFEKREDVITYLKLRRKI